MTMSNSVTNYTIVDGDTLQSIAQMVLGDASLWTSIAILNNLDYPFLVDLGTTKTANTVTAGDVILIPKTLNEVSVPNMIVATVDEKFYGSDIALSVDTSNLSYLSGGDFSIDPYGDLQTISGVECLKQDLLHRLMVPYGSLPYHPTYGSKFLDIIGQRNNANWRDKAVIELTKSFRSDPRVQNIINVIVNDSGGGVVSIDCTVITDYTTFRLSKSLG